MFVLNFIFQKNICLKHVGRPGAVVRVAIFFGVGELVSAYHFPRPHLCGRSQHWVCPLSGFNITRNSSSKTINKTLNFSCFLARYIKMNYTVLFLIH
jgi:hypothetical protein